MKLYERNPEQHKTAVLIHPMLSSAEGINLCVTNFWGEDVHCFVPDLSAHGEDAAARREARKRRRSGNATREMR